MNFNYEILKTNYLYIINLDFNNDFRKKRIYKTLFFLIFV